MQSYRNLLILATGVLTGLLLTGCVEDAEGKAARQAREACEQAIAIIQSSGDMEAARAALSRVQVSQLRGGDLAHVVAMVRGSVTLDAANRKAAGTVADGQFHPGLTVLAQRQAEQMQVLADMFYGHKRLAAERERIQKTIDGAQASLAELRIALTGDNGEGLEDQLARAGAELAGLQQERDRWQTQADAAVNAANALQAQAHEFFSKSDLADGEEKERLMQQGYNLLLGRSGGRSKEAILIESQAAFDQVSYLESSINIARAKVEHLTDGIAGINSQMPGFERTASAAALRGTINDISSQQARLASEIASQMGEVEKAATRFVTLADEVVALCEQARQEFSLAAGGRRVDPGAARFALADSQHRSAMLIAAIAASHEMLATHAESIAPAAADGYTMRKLQEMASQHSGKKQQLLVSASTLLDEACESYKAVSGMSRPAMCAALSGNILAYLERLRIASQLRETVTQVSMTEQLQALDARGLECGEEFAETLAGRMLADVMTSAGIPRATPIAPAADEYEREPAVPANAAPVDRPFVRETPDPNRPRAAAEDPNFSY